MLEFQNLIVMVFYMSMDHLVIIYIEVLVEPFKVMVKSHKPTTLKDSIKFTRDL